MQAAGQCTGTNSKCIGLVGLLTLPWTPPSEKNYTERLLSQGSPGAPGALALLRPNGN